jgi:hypothetical protein
MSANFLDELLSGYEQPSKVGNAEPSAAIPAIPATVQHPCGSAGDIASAIGCDSLRFSPKVGGENRRNRSESQTGKGLGSAYPCGESQESQESQGVTPYRQSGSATTAAPENDKSSGEAQPVAPEETDIPPEADPDRWCWPHSSAMTGREIDTFTARLARFADKGLSLLDGEALAGKLVTRDRGADERRLCLECVHLQVKTANRYRDWTEFFCGNWRACGLSVCARDNGLSRDFAHQLQRCPGFKTVTP